MLERGKNAKIDPNADDGGDDDSGDSAFIYCVTCGHEVPARRAVRHLENCFNKVSARKRCSIIRGHEDEKCVILIGFYFKIIIKVNLSSFSL